MTALNRKLRRDLWSMRGQALATAGVVAAGVALFIAMFCAERSLEGILDAYYTQHRFARIFAPLKRAPQAEAARIAAIPGVARVETRVVAEVSLLLPDLPEPATGRLISLPDRGEPALNAVYLRRGRMPQAGRADEVLASEQFAAAHGFRPGDSIGAIINGRRQRLVIAGVALSPEYVYQLGGGGMFPDDKRFGVFWMRRAGLEAAMDLRGAFNDLSLTTRAGASQSAIISAVDRRLARYGGLGAHGRELQLSHRFITDEFRQLRISGTVLPAIFLAVAAFLIYNVLSRLVAIQRPQIATLKAFGYSNLAVGWHYLSFAGVIILAGAVAGIAAGWRLGLAMTSLYARYYRFPLLQFELSPAIVAMSVLVSGGAALLGAAAAVWRATRLPPAAAMQPEPPAHFRATLIERLGWHRLLSPAGRIVLRNLERRPGRALLSALLIGLAAALLIEGGYTFDAIRYMIDAQFNVAQREDVTLAFNRPLSSRARGALARLPGVLRAEPLRAVAVRLGAGPRGYNTSLLGLPQGAALRRLVDRDLRVVALPREGLLLTKQLGKILGVAPGGTVRVEVLEGRRQTFDLPVAGFVDELLGVSAYMDLRALNRLLGEGGTVSGAWLSVDPRLSARFNARLRELPVIAGATRRTVALRSFDETLGQTLGVFRAVYLAFASLIVFSVIYNNARIAFAERGWEMASLRVLGFSRREISFILLSELAVVALAAIPPGCAIGAGLAGLITLAYESDLFRIPLVIARATYAYSALAVLLAAALSALAVRRRVDRLDLIAVLKTRE